MVSPWGGFGWLGFEADGPFVLAAIDAGILVGAGPPRHCGPPRQPQTWPG
jgi:hypothetical protein